MRQKSGSLSSSRLCCPVKEVIITRQGHPLVKLVPVQDQSGTRRIGAYEGKVKFHNDPLKPLPAEIIEDFWLKAANNAIST